MFKKEEDGSKHIDIRCFPFFIFRQNEWFTCCCGYIDDYPDHNVNVCCCCCGESTMFNCFFCCCFIPLIFKRRKRRIMKDFEYSFGVQQV